VIRQAPVRVKDWNFFLALGLSEKVKVRNWVSAAEKTTSGDHVVEAQSVEEVLGLSDLQGDFGRIY
jgi:hypothetical protein